MLYITAWWWIFLTRHKETWNKEKYTEIVYRTLFYCRGRKAQELRACNLESDCLDPNLILPLGSQVTLGNLLGFVPQLPHLWDKENKCACLYVGLCHANLVKVGITFPRTPPLYVAGLFLSKESLPEMCRVEMKQGSFNLWMALWSDVMMDRCRDVCWFSACPNFPSLPHSEVLPYLSCCWPRADSELPAGSWLRTHGGRSYKETTASLCELPFLLSFQFLDVPGFSDW